MIKQVSVTLHFDTVGDAVSYLAGPVPAETTAHAEPDALAEKVTPKPALPAVRPTSKPDGVRPPTKKVQALLDQHGLTADQITGTGKDGRVTMEDVNSFLADNGTPKTPDAPEQPETAPLPPVRPAADLPPEVEYPTLDDARDALKTLVDSKGLQAGFDVLSRFGVRQLSKLGEDQYPQFIEDVNKVLAGGTA